MREKEPIEEIIFAVFEMILTVIITIVFLYMLVTHATVPALIDLILVFGIVMNLLTGVYVLYNGYRALAAVCILLAIMCVTVIIL